VLLAMLALVTGLGVEARAQLLAPPWRDTAGTTYSDWEFSTSAAIAVPDIFSNGYGVPVATMSLGVGAAGYLSEFPPVPGGGVGVWDVGRGIDPDVPGQVGCVTLSLPVATAAGAGTTNVWIQAVYYQDIDGPPTVAVSGAILTASSDTLLATLSPPWGQWRVSLTQWQFPSAKATVQAVLTGNYEGTMFDSIVVDTQVVTPPGILTITATTNRNWVYQNTPGSTLDRHVLVLSASVTQDTFGNHSYTTTVTQSGPGLVTPTGSWTYGIPVTPTPSASWIGLTGYLVGGRVKGTVTSSGNLALTGSCMVHVVVTGNVSGSAVAEVTIMVSPLGDIDNSGQVDQNDLTILDNRLNARPIAPQTDDDCDLSGEGYVTTADQVLLRLILHSLPVP
jgi:hypothetical protein